MKKERVFDLHFKKADYSTRKSDIFKKSRALDLKLLASLTKKKAAAACNHPCTNGGGVRRERTAQLRGRGVAAAAPRRARAAPGGRLPALQSSPAGIGKLVDENRRRYGRGWASRSSFNFQARGYAV